MLDESPDTSYLGEYSNSATSDFSIDRRHTLDCASVMPMADAVKEKLTRIEERLYDERIHALDTETDEDSLIPYDEAIDCVASLRDNPDECDCDERGDMGRHEYRFFNPSFNYFDAKKGKDQPADGLTPEEVRKYVRQDYERMESLNAGHWQYIGIRAEAFVATPDGFGYTEQTIISGGLWGVESDSDKEHFAEIEQEELSQLRATLGEFGFSKRQIATAFKSVQEAS